MSVCLEPALVGVRPMNPRKLLDIRFSGHEENVRECLAKLRVWTTSLHFCAGFRGEIELVLAEVLNNIVEHAQPGCLNDKIHVRGELLDDRLAFQIVDYGAPLPYLKIPEGAQPRLDVEPQDLPEGGFGWMLVRNLTSDLHYERHPGANYLSLSFAPGRCL